MRSSALYAALSLALGVAACDRASGPAGVTEVSNSMASSAGSDIRYEVAHLASLGGTSSSGNGINNLGWIVGSSNLTGDASAHASLWRNGSLVDLGTLGGPNSNVAWPGVNNTGNLVVGIAETAELGGENWSCRFFFPSATGHQCLAFAWQNGVMTPLPTWGGTNGFATEVNSSGQVVGWAENLVEDPTCNPPVLHQFRGFMWDSRTGEMRELTPLSGDSTSTGNAINERGQVAGISGRCANAVGGFSAQHAVLWEPDGTAIDIGNLGGEAWHTPLDINQRGDVVGFGNPEDVPGDDFGVHAFVWTRHDGIKDLGVLPGDETSQALGINGRGQVVGLSRGPDGDRAVLWQDGVMTNLNTLVVPGYTGILRYAGHINDAGVITGAAFDPETQATVAFLATPVAAAE